MDVVFDKHIIFSLQKYSICLFFAHPPVGLKDYSFKVNHLFKLDAQCDRLVLYTKNPTFFWLDFKECIET